MPAVADLLFPDSCAGCSRLVRGGLCEACLRAVPRLGRDVCARCGRPSEYGVFRCPDCYRRALGFDKARQAARYSPAVRRLVHRCKYSGSRSSGQALASLILELLVELDSLPEVLTWVTPGWDRLRRSGVDHGQMIVRLVGIESGLPVRRYLTRVRATPPQMSLPPAERRHVLKGAFVSAPCAGLRVGVVDDVFTTGSTASEAGRALRKAGAASVTVLCAARSFTD